MPRLEAFFHYRNIDVSSVKELVKRWYPNLPPFEKAKSHLALSDIRESISELLYYRKYVFLP
jgi:oligoribonuclease